MEKLVQCNIPKNITKIIQCNEQSHTDYNWKYLSTKNASRFGDNATNRLRRKKGARTAPTPTQNGSSTGSIFNNAVRQAAYAKRILVQKIGDSRLPEKRYCYHFCFASLKRNCLPCIREIHLPSRYRNGHFGMEKQTGWYTKLCLSAITSSKKRHKYHINIVAKRL